jgi:GT2 family glycosyltransferase
VPRRRVLALSVYRPGSRRMPAVAEELRATRHELRGQFGRLGDEGLAGGKFENLNRLLAAADPAGYDWLLVSDDDVVLPERFVDRLLGLCERLGLALAQPAQTLASHGAWPVTRRRRGLLARETNFVEIGPVTAIRRDAAEALTPFPELRFGWGLDLHWGALARERGWRLGVLDALPVRHDEVGVASSYQHADAVEEARRFLSGRPFVPSAEADTTLAVHRRLA